MTEAEEMRKYAEAHGCGEYEKRFKNSKTVSEQLAAMHIGYAVRPLPCVRDEHGEIQEQTVKTLFAKVDEELNELKEAAFFFEDRRRIVDLKTTEEFKAVVAEEAADTITAITTLLEALGIDVDMRDEAQRRVNAKNKSRNRL